MNAALGLVERAHELAAVDALVAGAAHGEGSSLVVAGPAGIGKSALVGEAIRRARAAGVRALSVRPDERDTAVPFGVIRDLLAADVVGRRWPDEGTLAERAREVVVGEDAERSRREGPGTSVLHALYWLVADVADRSPLLLVVDDAQWADRASLRFLDHLVRRVEGLPVAVLAAVRRSGVVAADAVSQVLAWAPDRVLQLEPLTPDWSARVARRVFGADVPDDLAATVHETTQGNPLLVRELVGALREAGVAPHETPPELVTRLGARAVAHGVEQRLGRMSEDAVELARAFAVVGDLADAAEGGSGLGTVAGLVGLDAASAVDELVAADLVRLDVVPRFAHPLLGEAIRESVPPGRRDDLARAAAAALVERGDPTSAAAQLLQVRPGGDSWVVGVLRRAAAAAVDRGAPDVAAPLLHRALVEPPDPARRSEVLGLLGRAQVALGSHDAVATLEEATGGALDVRTRAELAGDLAQALIHEVRVGDAARALMGAADALREASAGSNAALADELELRAVMFGRWVPELRDLVVEHHAHDATRGDWHGELAPRLSLLLRASEAVSTCRPAAEGAALAERALVDDTLFRRSPSIAMIAIPLLAACGRMGLARRHLDAMIVHSRDAGALPELRAGIGLRGQLHMWEGDVLAAESDGWAMQDLVGEGELGPPYLLGFLTDALLAQGRVAEARAELERAGLWSGPLPDLAPLDTILWARGRVRAAQGELHAALEDLLLCGDREVRLGQLNEALVPWRTAAAGVLRRLGRHDEASAISAESLELARSFGADHVVGEALRSQAHASPDGADLELLHEARERLESSFARLALAHVDHELGVAVLAAGDRRAAREFFSRAAGLAGRLHATALAGAAAEGLVAAGGRPRRAQARGAAALTPSERRVADLAATGSTNREIAQALFVTEKTVETHLRRSYRKLEVGSRTQLADALARD